MLPSDNFQNSGIGRSWFKILPSSRSRLRFPQKCLIVIAAVVILYYIFIKPETTYSVNHNQVDLDQKIESDKKDVKGDSRHGKSSRSLTKSPDLDSETENRRLFIKKVRLPLIYVYILQYDWCVVSCLLCCICVNTLLI